MVYQMQVEELAEKLSRNEDIILIDCREREEHDFCKIEGAKLIPLSEFSERALKELKPDQNIVIHCHHGGRSQRACEFLRQNGFSQTNNVVGGIDAWALRIDTKIKRY